MKHLNLLLTVLLLGLLGCSGDTLSGVHLNDQAVETETAVAAKNGTQVFRIPRDFILPPDAPLALCAGEQLHITGETQRFFTVRNDEAGGFHIRQHNNPHFIATGLVTGTVYRVIGDSFNWHFNAKQPFPQVYNFTRNRRVVLPGIGGVQHIREREHFTVNANGVVTAFRYEMDIDCTL